MSGHLSIAEIKNRFTIYEAWQVLGYTLPRKWQACLSPWRKESKPSFSVFNEGHAFNDFSSGEGGDVIRFWALSRGINDTEALKEIQNHLGDVSYSPENSVLPTFKKTSKKRVVFPSDMRPLRNKEYGTFSRKRKIAPEVIFAISQLNDDNEEAHTAIRYGRHRGHPSLIFIEKWGEVINTACRRLDAEPYEAKSGGVKEHLISSPHGI